MFTVFMEFVVRMWGLKLLTVFDLFCDVCPSGSHIALPESLVSGRDGAAFGV
jgi:hypothetical protein